jgi:hypothetical protein
LRLAVDVADHAPHDDGPAFFDLEPLSDGERGGLDAEVE